jgi:regulatory protein
MGDPAVGAALKALARRDFFQRELAGRLLAKGFSEEEVERALARCGELGYLDDEGLARRFVEQRAVAKGWGPARLRAELRRRGAPRQVVEDAVAEASALVPEALAVALERIERRAKDGWWQLHGSRARMISSLVGRGFDTDDAYRAVHQLASTRESEHDAFDEC